MVLKVEILNSNGTLNKVILIEESKTYNKILKRSKSVLDLLLDFNINVYYGCMGGSCGSCILKVIKGKEFLELEYFHGNVFENLLENEFLCCIAKFSKKSFDNGFICLKLRY